MKKFSQIIVNFAFCGFYVFCLAVQPGSEIAGSHGAGEKLSPKETVLYLECCQYHPGDPQKADSAAANEEVFNILSKEKQSELIGRKDDFAKKAGITP